MLSRPTKIRSKASRKKKDKRPRLSRLHKPENLSLEDWQRQLRRQFGREQKFRIRNLSDQPIFSEFAVTNPQSRRTYRVEVRGPEPGANRCTCADFATNTLGTCKHIEFVLYRLEHRQGGRRKLTEGYHPAWSEVYLHYGVRREVRFRPGTECSKQLACLASDFFDSEKVLHP